MQAWTCVLGAVLFMGLAVGQAQQPVPPPQPVPEPDLKQLPVPEPLAGDALYAPLAVDNGPESLKTKTASYLVVTFGPRAVVSPMISAAIAMARPNYNYPNDWHQGMQGFGRQYGSRLGTKAAFETARYATGALLHEDFRYRPAEVTGFVPRTFHAIGFIFVDRSDSGHARLAVANFAGAAAGGFVPNAWLPDGFNDWRHGGTRMGTKFGGFAIANVLREFSPEIAHAFRDLHLPFPRLPVPEWWTKDITVARRP